MLLPKKHAKCSLPYLENECQRRVNNFELCIFGDRTGVWSQVSINSNRAALWGRYVQNVLATSSGTVTTHVIHRATSKYSWAFYFTETVITKQIDHIHPITLYLTIMEGQQLLTLHRHSFSRLGMEHSTFSVSCIGTQYFVYDYGQSITLKIAQATWPKTVDTWLTFIFMIRQVPFPFQFCWWSQQILCL